MNRLRRKMGKKQDYVMILAGILCGNMESNERENNNNKKDKDILVTVRGGP
jgi:hypothetical protein